MQPLIHKASVHLFAKKLPASATLGDPIRLILNDDGIITVMLAVPSRLPFGLGPSRDFLAGKLGDQASALLKPALQIAAHLRLRIVEIEPAHLNKNGQSKLYISVWGEPKSIISHRPWQQAHQNNSVNDPFD